MQDPYKPAIYIEQDREPDEWIRLTVAPGSLDSKLYLQSEMVSSTQYNLAGVLQGASASTVHP